MDLYTQVFHVILLTNMIPRYLISCVLGISSPSVVIEASTLASNLNGVSLTFVFMEDFNNNNQLNALFTSKIYILSGDSFGSLLFDPMRFSEYVFVSETKLLCWK